MVGEADDAVAFPLLLIKPFQGASLGNFTPKKGIFLMDRFYVQMFFVLLYHGGGQE